MFTPIAPLHVYNREVDLASDQSLYKIAHKIPQGARVLDLGPGTGALGRYLKAEKHCLVDGVELNPVQIQLIQDDYERVFLADLNQVDLGAILGPVRYDAIVCADVIEHLMAPEQLLRQLSKLLKPHGQVLISVPNVGYAGLLAHIMQGDFRYGTEGLLDQTHLRFFTRRSLQRLLDSCGLGLIDIDTVERTWIESEFQQDDIGLLPQSIREHLENIPDATAYQFLATARPGASLPLPAAHQLPFNWTNRVQLFWRFGDEPFNAANSVVQKAPIGSERVHLRFEFPATERSVTGLRWDPSDRPGYLRFFALRVRDRQGRIVWAWDGDAATLTDAPVNQLLFGQTDQLAGVVAMSTGDDPQIILPIPPAALALASPGGCLEVEQSAPLSAEFWSLRGRFLDPDKQLMRLMTAESDHQELLTLRESLKTMGARVAELERRQPEKTVLFSDLVAVNKQLDADLKAQFARGNALDERIALLEAQLNASQHELHSVYGSRIWRIAVLLRHLKLAVKPPAVDAVALPTSEANSPVEAVTDAAVTPSLLALTPPRLDVKYVAPQVRLHAGKMPTLPAPVDVIVPVYRGLAQTQACLQSVWACPQTLPFELIVIDDCSPEPALSAWLDACAQAGRITLLKNADNLGFVGTVNRGIALHPERDVVLLNSDTVVAGPWLDKLASCAYAEPNIATATPLSNNATICSYPRFCESNALPDDLSLTDISSICAQRNANAWLEIPTGVGFCFYIRRDASNDIGAFDETHFGKGYGEENDFCQRAIQKGWKNALAGDAFVFHEGGVSFGESQNPAKSRAMVTLAKLHPNYDRDVQRFVKADPVSPLRGTLDVARLQRLTLPLILLISHHRSGGTQKHIEDVAKRSAGRCEYILLQPTGIGERVRLSWLREREGMALDFCPDADYDLLLSTLKSLRLARVHIHHTLGLSPKLWTLPQALNLPYDYTAHDYYSACPQISLTRANGRYCQELGPADCAQCLAERPTLLNASIEDWRSWHAVVLDGADRVITPSHGTSERILRYFPNAKVLTLPHPEPLAEYPMPHVRPRLTDRPLRIAVIGGMSQIKGADVLDDCARDVRTRGLPLQFELIGYAYWHITGQANEAFPVSGKYRDEDLPRLLQEAQPDVVWFPAQWPESYSYTLSAVFAQGLPVVVSNLGALAERVVGRPWSWTVDWRMTTLELNAFFMQLRDGVFMGTPTWPQSTASGWRFPPQDFMAEYLRPLELAQTSQA